MFKVNTKDTRTTPLASLEKTPTSLLLNLKEHISHLAVVFLLLTLNM